MNKAVVLILCLTACNSPSSLFRGVPAQRVTIDGSTFDVRVRGELAEAIRTNTQYAPRLGPVAGRAAKAMALVSGRTVRRVSGDQALLLGQLDCDGEGGIYTPDGPVSLQCERIGSADRMPGEPRYAEYDCTAP